MYASFLVNLGTFVYSAFVNRMPPAFNKYTAVVDNWLYISGRGEGVNSLWEPAMKLRGKLLATTP